jgi:hypothetical protein
MPTTMPSDDDPLNPIIGKRVTTIREMTHEEMKREGWHESPHGGIALVFESGAVVFASRDDEGNGPGALFGFYPLDASKPAGKGEGFRVIPVTTPQTPLQKTIDTSNASREAFRVHEKKQHRKRNAGGKGGR